ncbi:MAG: hypothetical protein IJV50_07330 [Lachnospiraceae bacterium]|nr:hypothetical protein [Lachnospiraceae bacterium]
MSRATERACKELEKYLAEHGFENMAEEDMEGMVAEFIEHYNKNLPVYGPNVTDPQTADDFLELAEGAGSKKKALEYAQKALEIDSDCLDAERMVAELTAKNTMELLQKLEEVIAHGNQLMEQGGYFAEDEGVFWGVIETRPYMRVRYQYIQILKECGMIRKAVSECEDLLRLCENDNMGVRYMLMHLYVMLEMEEPMLQLHEKYGSYEETQMLFPLSILYFKLGDFEKSAEYLKRLYQVNPDIKQLVKMVLEGDAPDEIDGLESFGYQPDSMGELVVEFEENYGLFSNLSLYFVWAEKQLKRKRRSRKS